MLHGQVVQFAPIRAEDVTNDITNQFVACSLRVFHCKVKESCLIM